MSSDNVVYHQYNPDPAFDGCRNSGLGEDGVVFQNIEPLEGVFTFIGRTSITEAFALLYNTTPKKLLDALEDGTPKALKARIHKLEDEKALLAERLAQINLLLLEDAKKNEGSTTADIS